jgi:hypothetical protein
MALLVKNILTASRRSFGFRSGEVIAGSSYRFEKELDSRDCSARWSVLFPGASHAFVCELIDPDDDPLVLALTSNCLAANGMTRHPGLANILAAGWLKDGVYFQVLDLPPEEEPWRHPAEPMAEETFLLNAERLVEALIHMHKNNLVHAAISPDCLRSADGALKIAEFWWTRSCSGQAYEVSLESYYPGSLANSALVCLSPEIMAGARPSRESDLFSLGCSFFYLLAGEFPRKLEAYAPETELEIACLATAPLKDLEKIRPGLKTQIYEAIRFCLQRDDVARENIFLVRDLIKDACGRFAARDED